MARIAEDEEVARAASPAPWSYPGVASVAGGTLYDSTRRIADVTYEQPEDHDGSIVRHLLVPEADANGTHMARWDPARVLAECEAKRRIVSLHTTEPRVIWREEVVDGDPDPRLVPHVESAPNPTLRLLALPYTDHPDYDETWRP
jgi:hypothetical protein